MESIWIIVNTASGSFDTTLPERLSALATDHGAHVDRVISLPEEELPDATTLDAAGVTLLAIHSGDGTVNSAARRLGQWGGKLLVLPGGTMNLLARRLHATRDVAAIVSEALGAPARFLSVTAAQGQGDDALSALVGIFAGPTTAWGDVRESLRRRDIGGLVNHIPHALAETFQGAQVHLAGTDTRYPAIYVEPRDGQLHLLGFTAAGAGELFRHGSAWLGGDFRNGPHEVLGTAQSVTIACDAPEIGLLVDGEKAHSASPLTITAVRSPLRFLTTRPAA